MGLVSGPCYGKHGPMVRPSILGRGTLSVAVAPIGGIVRKKVGVALIVVVVLLAGLTVAQKVFGAFNGILPQDSEAIRTTLNQTSAKLAKARTARITFTGSLRPQVAGLYANWSGTTQASFSADPSWESTYDKVEVPGGKSVTAKVVHQGSQTLVSSPAMAAPDKRPWLSPKSTTIIWQHPLADPVLGITDFTQWEKILDTVTELGVAETETGNLPDLKGAPHEYKLVCFQKAAACPPPFGSNLDLYFNSVGHQVQLSAWYDDDGLLHRLDVEGSALWDTRVAGGDTPGETHPDGEYYFNASFTLDDFGSPVTVTMPADSQISTDHIVTLRS